MMDSACVQDFVFDIFHFHSYLESPLEGFLAGKQGASEITLSRPAHVEKEFVGLILSAGSLRHNNKVVGTFGVCGLFSDTSIIICFKRLCTSWCVPLNTIFIFPVNIILIDDIYLKPFEVRTKTFGAPRDTWSLLADKNEATWRWCEPTCQF